MGEAKLLERQDAVVASPVALRQHIRDGWSGLTTGLARGFLQGNLVILPEARAGDFVQFCENNARACPVLGVSKPGDFKIPTLAPDLDLRTDVGAYRVLRHGAITDEVGDIRHLWRDDLVAVVLGCWFSAEAKLAAAGIRMRHIELGVQGALFRTNVPCAAAGPFEANLVVSMRPFENGQVQRVVDVTSALPLAHGAPIHIGDPAALGIASIERPDFGEAIPPIAGETPLFWACGVTASNAVERARCDFAITHVPGRMVLTDVPA